MKHYMFPSVAKDPGQVVIHIGTNDLNPDSRSVANNIIELADEGLAKKHKVFVSSIICCHDFTLNNKVRQ